MQYRAFWECFESSGHKNLRLTTVDKFNYLLTVLVEKNALRAVKGLSGSYFSY
jgi:hypothetical protein